MSFEPLSNTEGLIAEWFDSLDAFVLANKQLGEMIRYLITKEVQKENPCSTAIGVAEEMKLAALHTDLTLAGLKSALMNLESFSKYIQLHVASVTPPSTIPNLELN